MERAKGRCYLLPSQHSDPLRSAEEEREEKEEEKSLIRYFSIVFPLSPPSFSSSVSSFLSLFPSLSSFLSLFLSLSFFSLPLEQQASDRAIEQGHQNAQLELLYIITNENISKHVLEYIGKSVRGRCIRWIRCSFVLMRLPFLSFFFFSKIYSRKKTALQEEDERGRKKMLMDALNRSYPWIFICLWRTWNK